MLRSYRCSSFARVAFIAVALVAGMRASVVLPDAVTARIFGAQLQQEFLARKSAAILDHVDGRAFTERVFGSSDVSQSFPWAANWAETPPPPIKDTVEALDSFPVLSYFRVVLDNDARILECDFINFNGTVQSATLFLIQASDGAVRVADFQWGGDAMSKSQLVRHTLLLQGFAMGNCRDTEEIQLAQYGRSDAAPFASLVRAYAMRDYKAAYAFLSTLPDGVRSTRICRHYLTCLDPVDKQAAQELRRALKAGARFDPIARFYVALADGDREAILAALDGIITTRQHPPMYECIKGNVLLTAGRAADASAIARETMAKQPLMGFAYLLGVRAASAQHSPDAISILQGWSRIAAPKQIDEILAAFPDLNDFRSSKTYSEWLQAAPPARG